MTDEQFRAGLAHAGDWVARYWAQLREQPQALPVLAPVTPGRIRSSLPDVLGDGAGVSADPAALVEELMRLVAPGITHWQHPNFYAFFPANASGPAVLGELLAAGLGVQGMLWATSPACTELETHVLDALGMAIGLPSIFHSTSPTGGGVIQGTASEAVLAALVAARHRIRALPNAAEARSDGSHLCVYTSTQAHSSVVKAAMIAGLATSPSDRTHVRLIDVDATCRMRVDALERTLQEDCKAGRTPAFVCATVGTTGTTAIDDVAAIARTVRAHAPRAWIHIDAAHAGAACICPEFQQWLAGTELCDSLSMNPHKWLLTNFDCDCFWTRDRQSLIGSMSIVPEYLRNSASDAGEVFDYRDWHVPLGRRFRALKLWLVLRWYGLDGLRTYIREHIRLAAMLEAWIRADARFEVCAPRTMNLVCFRLAPQAGESPQQTDTRTKNLLDRINASGRAFLTHTIVPGRTVDERATEPCLVIRMAIGATWTQEQHVRETWQMLQQSAQT